MHLTFCLHFLNFYDMLIDEIRSLKAEREIMDDQQIRHSNNFDGMVLKRSTKHCPA